MRLLLERGALVGGGNAGTLWTALHAAAFQEHAKVVRLLLDGGADPRAEDAAGRTPADYASISEAVWPFFAAAGCDRTAKAALVAKGIIRRAEPVDGGAGGGGGGSGVLPLSRPGSAYVRSAADPFGRASATRAPLESADRKPSLRSLGL